MSMRGLQSALYRQAPQIAKFVLSGGFGATIDLTSQWFFVDHLGINAFAGFVVSASMGALFVFVFNKFITFRSHSEPVAKQLTKFAAVYVPAIGLNFLLSSGFYWLGLPHKLAKAFAIGIGAVINYVFSAAFIFKKKQEGHPVVV